jgi:hypothetical protein
VLLAEFEDGLRGTPDGVNIAADYFEDRSEVIDVGLGGDVVGFDASRFLLPSGPVYRGPRRAANS